MFYRYRFDFSFNRNSNDRIIIRERGGGVTSICAFRRFQLAGIEFAITINLSDLTCNCDCQISYFDHAISDIFKRTESIFYRRHTVTVLRAINAHIYWPWSAINVLLPINAETYRTKIQHDDGPWYENNAKIPIYRALSPRWVSLIVSPPPPLPPPSLSHTRFCCIKINGKKRDATFDL